MENPEIDREAAGAWRVFKNAIVRSVAEIRQPYFELQRYNFDELEVVERERLYCYELYHQLRLQLGDSYSYILHGELDKRGQEFIRNRLHSEPIPDFVVHRPGHIGDYDQLAVVEVKTTANFTPQTAQQDIGKLHGFINNVGYLHGLLLVFGPTDPVGVVGQLELMTSASMFCGMLKPAAIPQFDTPARSGRFLKRAASKAHMIGQIGIHSPNRAKGCFCTRRLDQVCTNCVITAPTS